MCQAGGSQYAIKLNSKPIHWGVERRVYAPVKENGLGHGMVSLIDEDIRQSQ